MKLDTITAKGCFLMMLNDLHPLFLQQHSITLMIGEVGKGAQTLMLETVAKSCSWFIKT